MKIISQYHIEYTNLKIITKQVLKRIISSHLDLNGRAMTYYLGIITPQSYTDRQGNTISYLIISVHTLSSLQRTKASKHIAQSICVYSDGPPKPVSHMYHLYLYHCYYHITCICPQKVEAPTHMAQNFYVCSDRPQRPLISSVSLYLEGGVLSNDFKTISILVFIHILINTLNHTFSFIVTSKSTFLIFKILSYFIQVNTESH